MLKAPRAKLSRFLCCVKYLKWLIRHMFMFTEWITEKQIRFLQVNIRKIRCNYLFLIEKFLTRSTVSVKKVRVRWRRSTVTLQIRRRKKPYRTNRPPSCFQVSFVLRCFLISCPNLVSETRRAGLVRLKRKQDMKKRQISWVVMSWKVVAGKYFSKCYFLFLFLLVFWEQSIFSVLCYSWRNRGKEINSRKSTGQWVVEKQYECRTLTLELDIGFMLWCPD